MNAEKVNRLPAMPTSLVEKPPAQRSWRVWLAAVVIGITVGYVGSMVAKEYLASPSDVGADYAPDFLLENLSGDGTISLADYKGQALVFNFWASWCFPCRLEMPALQQAWEANQGQNIIFIGVNVWDEKQSALDFLAEYGVTYPNGFDPLELIQDNYDLMGVPTTWFIFPDGSVSHQVRGPLDLESLDEMIALILAK